MITGLHHFAIIVSSEKSIPFYEKLGFRVHYAKKRRCDKIVLLDGYGIQLEMFIDSKHPSRTTNPENLGLRHLALKVNMIEKTVEELGIKSGPVMKDWIGMRFCFVMDPDGLPIELHE